MADNQIQVIIKDGLHTINIPLSIEDHITINFINASGEVYTHIIGVEKLKEAISIGCEVLFPIKA